LPSSSMEQQQMLPWKLSIDPGPPTSSQTTICGVVNVAIALDTVILAPANKGGNIASRINSVRRRYRIYVKI
jgi:hypothetical protein